METLELEWKDTGYRGQTILGDGRLVRVKIEQDTYGDCNPRDWDNLGVMVCWHSRYNLGDEQVRTETLQDYLRDLASSLDPTVEDHIRYWVNGIGWQRLINNEDYDSAEEKSEQKVDGIISVALDRNIPIMIPLYLYDHSGLTMSASNARYPFNDRWDAGQVGYIYVTREAILKEYGMKRLTKNAIERARKILLGEVETYDQYLRGEVYGYTIEVISLNKCQHCGHVSEDLDFADSCWGYLGDPRDYLLGEVNSILEQFDVEVEI